MRSWRILVLALILVLAVPVLALAAGPFYVSTAASADPEGSGLSPANARRATNLAEWEEAIADFAESLDEGQTATVYWWTASVNQYCVWTLSADGTAQPGRCLYGSPPETGVDLTPPLVVGGLLALAAALFGAAWFLLRRQRRMARA